MTSYPDCQKEFWKKEFELEDLRIDYKLKWSFLYQVFGDLDDKRNVKILLEKQKGAFTLYRGCTD